MTTAISRRGVLAGAGAVLLGGCAGQATGTGGRSGGQTGAGAIGIVGTLTETDGLAVNGLSVGTGEATTISDAFGEGTRDALLIGHSLTLEAATAGDGLIARRIHVTHPVIGTVQSVGLGGIEARVAGVRVLREPGAVGGFETGQTVAISGLWQGNTVIASRVDPIEPRPDTVIAGVLGRDGETGKINIARQRLVLPEGLHLNAGIFATVIGTATPDAIEVASVVPGRFTGAAGDLSRLSVEGFLEPARGTPSPAVSGLAVSGLGHSLGPGLDLEAHREGRALFDGSFSGTFDVERATRLPEHLDERRALLGRVLTGAADDPAIAVGTN